MNTSFDCNWSEATGELKLNGEVVCVCDKSSALDVAVSVFKFQIAEELYGKDYPRIKKILDKLEQRKVDLGSELSYGDVLKLLNHRKFGILLSKDLRWLKNFLHGNKTRFIKVDVFR